MGILRRAKKYLKSGENNVIHLRTDEECEMAELYVNDELLLEGNYWDFSPFVSPNDAAEVIVEFAKILKVKASFREEEYECEEECEEEDDETQTP